MAEPRRIDDDEYITSDIAEPGAKSVAPMFGPRYCVMNHP